VKTSYEKKVAYIKDGSPIAADLLTIFPGDTSLNILDVGACDGLDSIIYSNLFPNSQIYAIEAREDNYIELVDNIKIFEKFAQITPGHFCLSSVVETSAFYSSSGQSGNVQNWDTGNKSSSLFKPTGHLQNYPWCKFTKETIKTRRFDSLGIPRIDFIHLDVQGAEVQVLRGMGKVFGSVKAIWAEVAAEEFYEGQPLVKDVEGFMLSHKFTKAKDTTRKFGDQLWLRK
jgi:FkbM family methyltransferase